MMSTWADSGNLRLASNELKADDEGYKGKRQLVSNKG